MKKLLITKLKTVYNRISMSFFNFKFFLKKKQIMVFLEIFFIVAFLFLLFYSNIIELKKRQFIFLIIKKTEITSIPTNEFFELVGYYISRDIFIFIFLHLLKLGSFLVLVIFVLTFFFNIKELLLKYNFLQKIIPFFNKIEKIKIYYEKYKKYKFLIMCINFFIIRVLYWLLTPEGIVIDLFIYIFMFLIYISIYIYNSNPDDLVLFSKIPIVSFFLKKKDTKYVKISELDVDFGFLQDKVTPDIVKYQKFLTKLEKYLFFYIFDSNIFSIYIFYKRFHR